MRKYYLDLAALPEDALVPIKRAVPNIAVDLKNNTERRWALDGGAVSYRRLKLYRRALARVATVKKIRRANEFFMREHNVRLKIIEAYRSFEMQRRLREHYAIVNKLSDIEFDNVYVARVGENDHQKGTALDVTLEHLDSGEELKMPSYYLDLSDRSDAYPEHPEIYTERQLENLALMQEVMVAVGFRIFEDEWWHFDDVETQLRVGPVDLDPDHHEIDGYF